MHVLSAFGLLSAHDLAMHCARVQGERIAELESQLSVARKQIGELLARPAHRPDKESGTSALQSHERERYPDANCTDDNGTKTQPLLEQLGEAQMAVMSRDAELVKLRGQLAQANGELRKWEATLIQPEDLEAIRSGNPEHDRISSQLQARMEQYFGLYRQAQSQASASAEKRQVHITLKVSTLCMRWTQSECKCCQSCACI